MKALLICCLLFVPVIGKCLALDDPIFRYRCAEAAYQAKDYRVAQDFYADILAHSHSSTHLGLLCMSGLLDSMLANGDWIAADALIIKNDFSNFQHLFGYDSLLLRECFLLIKNGHFVAAKNLLFSIDFLALNDADLGWYHCLYALILWDQKNFHDAKSEFDIAIGYCSNDVQLAVIDAFKLQCEISNLSIDSDIDHLAHLLEKKIQHYGCGSRALPFLKQYILLYNFSHHPEKISNTLVEDVLGRVETTEEMYEILLYQALYLGLPSDQARQNLSNVLLNSKNQNTKLLALKLVTSAVFDEEALDEMFNFLQSIFEKTCCNWLKKQLLLAKLALAVKNHAYDVCHDVANQYISMFEHDKYFAEICELLAYLSVREEAGEYRLSVHYLDKLRVAAVDNSAKLAITLQIANAFFQNRDFRLASDMYAEVLALDESKKFQYIVKNLVISDLEQGDFDSAERHLALVDVFSQEKCDAIVLLLKAFRKKNRLIEGIEYIDSIDDSHLPKLFRLKLYLCKSRLLMRAHRFSQAALWATKILDALPDKANPIVSEIISAALFTKGCCLLNLRDYEEAEKVFECLRTNFKDLKYASLSLIKEGEYWQNVGENARALALFERCQEERYLSYARYKSAEILRAIGNFSDALKLLELIIRENGQTELAVSARIAQGDTLRLSGQFSDADTIYNRVLSETHDDDQLRYTALAHVRCLLAQSNKKPSAIDHALIELEKLYLSPCPILAWRLEVAAEYCLALKLKNDFVQLQTIALEALKLLPDDQEKMDKNSIFWVLQILYFLHDNFDSVTMHNYSLKNIKNLISKYQEALKNE